MNCFRHYDILAKTRSGMPRAISFTRRNDTFFHARALIRVEKSPTRSRTLSRKSLFYS